MKKFIYLLSVFSIALTSWGYEDQVEKNEEMKAYLPNIDDRLIFQENPIKFLEAIQLDYHFNKNDSGLHRIEEALVYVAPLYEQDKNQILFPEKLKEGQAYKLYSALYTLKGMLLSQKARGFDGMKTNLEDRDELRIQTINQMREAQNSLKIAVEADPSSAEAYFQLGKLYQDIAGDLASKEAEEAFYNAARLAGEQSNEQGYKQALVKLQTLNPHSEYLKRLEK